MFRPSRRFRTTPAPRNSRIACDTFVSDVPTTAAMSQTHNSPASNNAYRIRTRVGSPNKRNISANAPASSTSTRDSATAATLPLSTRRSAHVPLSDTFIPMKV